MSFGWVYGIWILGLLVYGVGFWIWGYLERLICFDFSLDLFMGFDGDLL